MTRIEVPELGVLRCALTPEQGRRLAGSGVLDAAPSPEDPGLWDLRAGPGRGGAVRMKPDLVWEQGGRPVAVVDAKYKRETPAGYPDADLYQMLAYCTALALPRGHLVYAQGGVEPARHVVRHTRIEIVCHALNLALPPAALLAAVARLAEELVAVDTAAT